MEVLSVEAVIREKLSSFHVQISSGIIVTDVI